MTEIQSIFQRLCLALCIFGPVGLLAALGAVALWKRGTSAARRSWGRVAFAAAMALPAIYLGATKGGRVTVDDDYIQDAGSYLTNDVAHIAISKKSALLPDDTEILVYARLLSQSNATDWVRLEPHLTFADHPHDYALPNATNYNVIVAASYTPSPTVHTNGVWVVRGFEIPDREGTFAFGDSKIAKREARDYPYKYQVEYLESTGTQYIDLGIRLSSDGFKYAIKLLFTGSISEPSQVFSGRRIASNRPSDSLSLFKFSSGFRFDLFSSVSTSGSIYSGTWYELTFNGTTTTINGNVISTPMSSGTSAETVYLFGGHRTDVDGAEFMTAMRLAYAKFYQSGTLVRDFIPVVDWNDVPAMFDRVTQTFFYNQGSGSFTVGPRID